MTNQGTCVGQGSSNPDHIFINVWIETISSAWRFQSYIVLVDRGSSGDSRSMVNLSGNPLEV